MTAAFWNAKRVLVTGHTGFKGAWASLWLASMGARVTGFALPPDTSPNLFDAARAGHGIQSILGDVRDLAAVDAAVNAAKPDIVLHMAAQALVRRGYRDPVGTYATNVQGTVHLLDALRRRSNARAVVVVTSDKCYRNRDEAEPFREDAPMGGDDPYSSSKGCTELVIAAYRHAYFATAGMGLASARAGNVIGGGDWAEDRLISDVVRSFAAGEAVAIRNPGAVRPWQHVLDALAGYFALAERLYEEPQTMAESFNFGPSADDARSVGDIVGRMATLWGGGRWTEDPEKGPHEARHLTLDASKARAMLGWSPRLSLDKALAWVVEWHRAHGEERDMRTVTVRQIERYQALRSAG
ncbi:CDP-glucose 4,6-dehydratase [Hyphomicrobium sp.]|uniref:CDP-glucose 4,6-dehydratase n=1 Tax=Hyphomicrobium sp. TaxID=82 RepID=UPI002FE23721